MKFHNIRGVFEFSRNGQFFIEIYFFFFFKIVIYANTFWYGILRIFSLHFNCLGVKPSPTSTDFWLWLFLFEKMISKRARIRIFLSEYFYSYTLQVCPQPSYLPLYGTFTDRKINSSDCFYLDVLGAEWCCSLAQHWH